uniref:Uncharacterized protein n=1 Tax=Rhizophora mucronata TaxID=61149 RepID=A0A2P2QRQ5_RHIMU
MCVCVCKFFYRYFIVLKIALAADMLNHKACLK